MATGNSTIGGGVASKVAGVVADASARTRSKLLDPTRRMVLQTQDDFFRILGGEIRSTIGPLYIAIADTPDVEPWVRDTFRFLGREHGQWQGFLSSQAAGAAMGGGLLDVITNALAPATQRVIRFSPNFLVSLGDAVSMAARGRQSFDRMEDQAARQGISGAKFRWLVDAARSGPPVGDILTALNRRLITDATARKWLRDAGIDPEVWGWLLDLRRQLISPERAAELVNFGVFGEERAQRIARDHGMSESDMDALILGGGQAPGVEFLLAARNRGIIDDRRLNRGILQGPIRNEWFDVVRDMRTTPPSVTAALDAFNQNLLTEGRARDIARDNGLQMQHFDWLAESAGRPFGVEQMGELWRRGKISRGEFRQAFLESNVKNKYVDLIFDLSERLPTMEMTARMVREGALTPAQGIRNLRNLGFNQSNAEALIDLARREQTSGTRDLTVTMVRELFEEQAITRRQALDALQALGYSRDNAEWVLAIAELRRERRIQNQGISRVRSRFVAHRIDQREAENALDQLRVPASQRADLIDAWQIERDVSTPRLTTSQIQQALRRGLLDANGARRRLLEAGYTTEDANILVSLATPTS